MTPPPPGPPAGPARSGPLPAPPPVPFVKMEGCGNDYVYVDVGLTPDGIDASRLDPVDAFAREISHRNYGIGSDGLITLDRGAPGAVRMRMWNADGSEGKLCLNGLRCAAKYAAERVAVLGDRFVVETASGPREVTVFRGAGGIVTEVEVRVGRPDFRRAALPATGAGEELWGETIHAAGRDYEGFAVSVGNPHLVLWLAGIEELHHAHLGAVGYPLEHDDRFPDGINVHLVALREEGGLAIRTWERGSGVTLACGSGAVAAYAVARRLGRVPAAADVEMTGGTVNLRADGDGVLVLRGPARELFRGAWAPSPPATERAG